MDVRLGKASTELDENIFNLMIEICAHVKIIIYLYIYIYIYIYIYRPMMQRKRSVFKI
jgi:hypothetical protein